MPGRAFVVAADQECVTGAEEELVQAAARVGGGPRREVRVLGLARALGVRLHRAAEQSLAGGDPGPAAVERLLAQVALGLGGDVATDRVVLPACVHDLRVAGRRARAWLRGRHLRPLAAEADRQL